MWVPLLYRLSVSFSIIVYLLVMFSNSLYEEYYAHHYFIQDLKWHCIIYNCDFYISYSFFIYRFLNLLHVVMRGVITVLFTRYFMFPSWTSALPNYSFCFINNPVVIFLSQHVPPKSHVCIIYTNNLSGNV